MTEEQSRTVHPLSFVLALAIYLVGAGIFSGRFYHYVFGAGVALGMAATWLNESGKLPELKVIDDA